MKIPAVLFGVKPLLKLCLYLDISSDFVLSFKIKLLHINSRFYCAQFNCIRVGSSFYQCKLNCSMNHIVVIYLKLI